MATSTAKRDRDGIRRLDADIKKLQAKKAKLMKAAPDATKPKVTKPKAAKATTQKYPYLSP